MGGWVGGWERATVDRDWAKGAHPALHLERTDLADGGVTQGISRFFRAIRALRPLRIINQFDGVNDIFEVVFLAWRDLLRAIALLLLVYFPFAIWGVNIFSGEHCRPRPPRPDDNLHVPVLTTARNTCAHHIRGLVLLQRLQHDQQCRLHWHVREHRRRCADHNSAVGGRCRVRSLCPKRPLTISRAVTAL